MTEKLRDDLFRQLDLDEEINADSLLAGAAKVRAAGADSDGTEEAKGELNRMADLMEAAGGGGQQLKRGSC